MGVGKIRNQTCVCGSGKKIKHCCKGLNFSTNQDKEFRFDNLTSKGRVEIKVLMGQCLVRKELYTTEKDIEKRIVETDKIQKMIDRICSYQSFYIIGILKLEFSKHKSVEFIEEEFGVKDFDIEKWVNNNKYYFNIFDNHNNLHEFIIGYGEYHSVDFINGLCDSIKNSIIPKDKPNEGDLGFMDIPLSYWRDVIDHHGYDEKDEELIFDSIHSQYGIGSKKYDRVPLFLPN
jgi:hypothetical protein